MNWITSFVRPKLDTLLNRRESPDNLWIKCPECGEMIFHRALAESLQVCPHCGHHMPISPDARFDALFDEGRWDLIPLPDPLLDPLKFRDEKRYVDRLREARKKLNRQDAMAAAKGAIGGVKTVVAAQNFAFMAGSMGMAVGDAILTAARTAVAEQAPFVLFSAAGGARMQEGILSLMQMPRATIAVQMVKEAGLPYVVVLTHPTTGGVTASYAMLGDVQIAEPKALICFAGPRVIEQTIREKLPEGFQRSEYLLDHGMLDMVTDRREHRPTLARLLRLLMDQPPEAPKEEEAPKEKPPLLEAAPAVDDIPAEPLPEASGGAQQAAPSQPQAPQA